MLTLLMTLLVIGDGPSDDLKDMAGTWVLVSTADGRPGTKVTKRTDRNFKLSVKGTTARGFRGDKSGTASNFTVDPTKTPKQIDLFHPEAGHLKGIYELDGDIMRSSFSPPGQERPTSFSETTSTISLYEREMPRS
ncbi:TIGR03067 domain-containing protein [Singulisphaera sp. PoT]|uniref:TIGR03067 domain-containing protein n=1 Tax=Singulisphaera sp. PoT TaxID=3411797 RepID=UPI003BF45F1A